MSVRSGIPQRSVLGPLLFLLYIELKLYAHDVALYWEIKSEADCRLLQEDLDYICSCANRWQLRLNGLHCKILESVSKSTSRGAHSLARAPALDHETSREKIVSMREGEQVVEVYMLVSLRGED